MKILTSKTQQNIAEELYQCKSLSHVLLHRITELQDTRDPYVLHKMADEIDDLSNRLYELEKYFKEK